MKVAFNYNGHYRENNPSAIALGTFDGIHLGHRQLIAKLKEQKEQNGYNTIVYTFLTHPLRTLAPDRAPSQIMLLKEKIKGFSQLDIDTLVLNPFNDAFLHQTPQDFLNQLIDLYNVRTIIVGFNYRFGYKGMGDIAFLNNSAAKLGFDLICVPPVTYEDEIISSSLIRELISKGDMGKTARLLTKPYIITGEVVHGFGRGSNMGFPTANIEFSTHKTIPKSGVYLSRCYVQGKVIWGVTSVGKNPTFSQSNLNIETYLLNFQGDLYGKKLKIEFLSYLRDEIKFNSIDDLKIQIKYDVEKAKKLIYNFL